MKQFKRFFIYISVLFLTFVLFACNGDGFNSTPDTQSTLTIGITDAPIDDAKEVNITITKIEISKDGSGWQDYYEATTENPAEMIDLLEFSKGNVFKFDTTEFESGQYAQIRLYLSTTPTDNTIKLLDDTVYNLDINSSIQNNGLKVVSGFTITEGVETELTIDFDVRKSIVVKNPNATPPIYSLKPTLKLITNDVSGNIIFTEAAVGNLGMNEGDVFFLYAAGFNASNELTEEDIIDPETETAYENSKSSAIAFIDTNDNNALKIKFPFMEYASYDLYKQDADTELIVVAGQAGITLSADDNGELIISE